jgi:hypothetical protein
MPSVFKKEQVTRYDRYLAVTLSLTILLSPGIILAEHQDEADGRSHHKLILIWNDPYQLLQTGFERITEDVDSIFWNLGVDIEWNKNPSMVLERSRGEILVLLRPEKPGGWMPGKNVMGVVSHSGPPVIRIFFDNVTKTLGLEPVPVRSDDSEERIFYMIRAMARILAHEIIHVIAPAHPHASDGLMNPRLTRAYLTDDEVNLDQDCTDAFVTALKNPPKWAVE